MAGNTDLVSETSLIEGGKFLTFALAEEDYGIGILKVKEIIGMMPITEVPQMPRYIKGVLNLRGKVIPVLDLRQRFNLQTSEYDERTCIIVVETSSSDAVRTMGIIVDSVSEVANISSEHIEEAPDLGHGLDTHYIHGIAKVDGGVKILLDIDRTLSDMQLCPA
jgi:purine-binding chemotaxis protein CheW